MTLSWVTRLATLSLCCALSTLSRAPAAEYPDRLVTIVNPSPAGGTADLLCRLLAEKLKGVFAQPFIVENRPGAAGLVAAEFVSRANPDGHVLLCSPEFVFFSHLLHQKISFDPLGFAPVSVVATFPTVIVGRANLPIDNLGELIAFARSRPGTLNYASQGKGSMAQLIFEAVKLQTSVDIVHIPYRGGPLAINDLLAGQVDLYAGPLVATLPHIRAGKLKLLAVAASNRLPDFPDIPALAEVLPNFQADTWMAVAAPPRTAENVTHKLSAAIGDILKLPDVAARIRSVEAVPVGSTPAQMAEVLRANVQRWEPVIRAAKISAD